MQDMLKPSALKTRLMAAAQWADSELGNLPVTWAIQVSETGQGVDVYLTHAETVEHRFFDWKRLESLTNRDNPIIEALEFMHQRLLERSE